jgi:putative copper export protein
MPGPVEILFVVLWPLAILVPLAMTFGWTLLTKVMAFVTVLNVALAASWLAARRKGNFEAAAGWRRGSRAIVYTLGGLLLLCIALFALLMWSCGQLFP